MVRNSEPYCPARYGIRNRTLLNGTEYGYRLTQRLAGLCSVEYDTARRVRNRYGPLNILNLFPLTYFQEICAICAEHSLTKARYDEAALLFQRSDDIANALRCYELARDHRKYVERAKACRQPREQVVAKLKKLVEEQESRKNFAAVAEMLAYIDEEVAA